MPHRVCFKCGPRGLQGGGDVSMQFTHCGFQTVPSVFGLPNSARVRRKRWQEPLFAFFSLPRGRSVLSRPSRRAIRADHVVSRSGQPRADGPGEAPPPLFCGDANTRSGVLSSSAVMVPPGAGAVCAGAGMASPGRASRGTAAVFRTEAPGRRRRRRLPQ